MLPRDGRPEAAAALGLPAPRLRVEPGAEAWAPSPETWALLQGAYPVNVDVVLLPRRRVAEVRPRQEPPYAFRAWSQSGSATVLVDPTETRGSVEWLLAHELGHHLLMEREDLRAPLRAGRPVGVDPRSDAFHRLDPEERQCDEWATEILGARLDRDWWRRRTPPNRTETFGARFRTVPPPLDWICIA